MTNEGVDTYGANVAYSADNYGVSLTYGVLEVGVNENNYTALNGYYSFDNGLNLSAGYETGDAGGALLLKTKLELTSLEYPEVGPGELGCYRY